jgi:Zn-dependent protease with chaperone function
MRWRISMALLVGLGMVLAGAAAAQEAGDPEGKGEKVDGYAEWRMGSCLISDGQKVCPAAVFKLKGEGEAKSFESIPLGYELKAKGTRLPDGTLLAREVEAKPNGMALFEREVRSATDGVEARARRAGHFTQGEGRGAQDVGQLDETGPQVERVRGIVDSLLPPYLRPEDVRVYVIENKEWNAFAMGNYSIYVFTGLLDDMDDDEVAIVLGHELVHATHEHSRKQVKKEMTIQLIAAGVIAATSTIDDDTKRLVAQLTTGLLASAWSNGYGRGEEDQADRVGLRYAYEAGYDIAKGPRLWNRFAKKYGEGNKVVNFFFGDHSRSAARASKLEKEIAFNYPEGPKPDGPARLARRARPAEPPSSDARATTAPPAAASALVGGSAPVASAPAGLAGATEHVEIRPGMTPDQVRRALGAPQAELVAGDRTRWTYPDLVVIFEKGRVKEVRF